MTTRENPEWMRLRDKWWAQRGTRAAALRRAAQIEQAAKVISEMDPWVSSDEDGTRCFFCDGAKLWDRHAADCSHQILRAALSPAPEGE